MSFQPTKRMSHLVIAILLYAIVAYGIYWCFVQYGPKLD